MPPFIPDTLSAPGPSPREALAVPDAPALPAFDLGARVESTLDAGGWVIPFIGDSRTGVADGAVFTWSNLATITSAGNATNAAPNNQPLIGTFGDGTQAVVFDGTVGSDTDFLATAAFDASAYDSAAICTFIEKDQAAAGNMIPAAFGMTNDTNVAYLETLGNDIPRMSWVWGTGGAQTARRGGPADTLSSAETFCGTLDNTLVHPQLTIRIAGADVSSFAVGVASSNKQATHPFYIGNGGLLGSGFSGKMGFVFLAFKVGAIDASALSALASAEALIRTDFGVI